MSLIECRGAAIATFALVLIALFTRQLVTSTHRDAKTAPAPVIAAPAPPTDISIESDSPSDDPDAHADLNGNDVSPAVAKYSFDALGSLYEVHSPQTELPRLGAPKS